MDQPWQIDLLGGLRARGDDRTITRFRTHKTGLLLAYLAFQAQRTHSRVALAEMLWPESEPAAGRLNLRVELASLRRLLEPPGVPHGGVLLTSHSAVQLNPDILCTDVAAFEAAIRVAGHKGDSEWRIEWLRRAVELYRGELLPGYYEDWIMPERRRLADLHLAALRELSGLLQQAGDQDGAIEAAHRAVAADPLNEEAHLDLIRLYAVVSRPADALRQYHELEQNLRDGLNEQPSAVIRQFAAHLGCDAGFPLTQTPGMEVHRPTIGGPSPIGADRSEDTCTASSAERAGPRLPLTFTRFFGRDVELARLEGLLLGHAASDSPTDQPGAPTPDTGQLTPNAARLVTLTGPGGSGKTRLAIEVARRLSTAYRDAIWFVPLADVTDAALIVDAVAEALRLPRSSDVERIEQIAMVFGSQPSLLFLDNLEHLLDAGRDLVRQLLHRVPTLVCTVTSRQRLDLEGEREIPVGPLEVPGLKTAQSSGLRAHAIDEPDLEPCTLSPEPSALMQCPSVALFVDRAQAVRPDFQVTPRNAEAVAALCTRLEGIPLAVELAAAWAQTLTPAQMVAHVNSGSSFLVSRRKDAPPRHQSLHGTIEWSFRLLDPSLQRFFTKLAVFRGGWDHAAAQFVCNEPDALSRLAALRDRSLVVAEEHTDAMRCRLLESVREYARERLTDDEWHELTRRHAAHFLRLAVEAEEHLQGAQQKAWAERLKAEHGNLQAALEYSEQSREGLHLAAALYRFWQLQWHLQEGSECLNRTLAAQPSASPGLRAKALFGAASLAYLQGDRARAEALCAKVLSFDELPLDSQAFCEAIRPLMTPYVLNMVYSSPAGEPMLLELLRRGQDDPRVLAFLFACRGRQATARGDYGLAVALHQNSLAIYRELGDWQGVAALLAARASVEVYQGDYQAASRYWEESLRLSQELDDPTGISFATGNLGYGAYLQADYRRAEALVGGPLALARSRQSGSPANIASHLWLLGSIACCRGQYDRAAALLEESLEIRRGMGVVWAIADTLSTLGVVAHSRGDYTNARALQQEALELRIEGTDKLDTAYALHRLAFVALAEGRYEEADRLLQESLALSREMRSDAAAAQALRGLGLLACRSGGLATAEERLRENLALHFSVKDRRSVAEALEAMAELRARQKRAEEATALYGTSDAVREAIDAPMPSCDRLRYTRELASLRAALGPERFAAVWDQARQCSIDEALVNALEPGCRCATAPPL